MVSDGLCRCINNRSMRGRLYMMSLLSDRGLSNRFQNVKKIEKSGVLATFSEVANRLNSSKNTMFANCILI